MVTKDDLLWVALFVNANVYYAARLAMDGSRGWLIFLFWSYLLVGMFLPRILKWRRGE